MGEWKPIESAPRDGREILAFCNAWFGEINGMHEGSTIALIAAVESKNSDAEQMGYAGPWFPEIGGDAYACWMRPTHWMPLPKPPKSKNLYRRKGRWKTNR